MAASTDLHTQLAEVLDLLACPACYGGLAVSEAGVVCASCGRAYPTADGIPVLLVDRATPGDGPAVAAAPGLFSHGAALPDGKRE